MEGNSLLSSPPHPLTLSILEHRGRGSQGRHCKVWQEPMVCPLLPFPSFPFSQRLSGPVYRLFSSGKLQNNARRVGMNGSIPPSRRQNGPRCVSFRFTPLPTIDHSRSRLRMRSSYTLRNSCQPNGEPLPQSSVELLPSVTSVTRNSSTKLKQRRTRT